MATLNPERSLDVVRLPAARRRKWSLRRLRPRRCMLLSTISLLAGFGVSLLMVIGVLPLSILIWFVSWFLVVVSGALVLIFWGEF